MNMIKLTEVIGYPTLEWHIKHKKRLSENIYRYSSDSFLNLFREAREAHNKGMVLLEGLDKELVETTDIGLYGEYNGNKVPLDLPMEIEIQYQDILEDIETFGGLYEGITIEDSYDIKIVKANSNKVVFEFLDKHGIRRRLDYYNGGTIKLLWYNPKDGKWSVDDIPRKYEDQKVMNTFGKIIIKALLPKYKFITFTALNEARYRLFRALIYNNLDKSTYEMDYDDETLKIEVYNILEEQVGNTIECGKCGHSWEIDMDDARAELCHKCGYDSSSDSYDMEALKAWKELNEAKYQGKEVALNKPKRGGSKKFYVYTKNPKTKKVIKVSFGAEGGGQNLAVKFKEPGARASFAARHKCSTRKDKTKASYWSCRLPRYWKQLGGDKNYSGFW
jgi:hypothetical protein